MIGLLTPSLDKGVKRPVLALPSRPDRFYRVPLAAGPPVCGVREPERLLDSSRGLEGRCHDAVR